MKPTRTPPLEQGEAAQTTPWQLIQRRRQPKDIQAGRNGNRDSRLNMSTPLRKKSGRNGGSQSTLISCWGLKNVDVASRSTLKIKANKAFGNNRKEKDKKLIRCASHNIHNMPEQRFTARSREIAAMAEGKDTADIRMWQEIGLYWPKVNEDDRWYRRTSRRALGTLANFAFNTNEHHLSAPRQPGGTAVITNARLSSKVKQKGVDPRNLGRWSWVRCGEDGKMHSTFISVYRPCIPSTSAGSTTYDQHVRHIEANDPRELLLNDLAEEIEKFQNKGDNIIIGMDANENVKGRRLKRFMDKLNLKDAVLSLHGEECPSTTESSDSNKPVDIIMCSVTLNPVYAGYDPDGGCSSDHSWVWADFDPKELFGTDHQDYHQFVCKLNTDDPRLAKTYTSESLKIIRKEKLEEELEKLMTIPAGSFSQDEIKKFDDIVKRTTCIRNQVTARLRHIYRGNIDWSPAWREAQDKKHLWWLVWQRRRIQAKQIKGRIGIKKIRRLMVKYKISDALTISTKEVQDRLEVAKQEYKTACKKAPELRETFKETLDEAMANHNNTTIEIERRKRKAIEKQKEAGRALSRLKRKDKPKASKVFITTEQGRLECSTKQSIEWACMKENRKRFTQSHSTPPMESDVTERIGFYAESKAADRILDATEDLEWVKDPYLKMVMEELRKPEIVNQVGDISPEISLEEHIKGWEKQKLRTSSERSQLLFPDFKAATTNKRLAALDRNIRQIPYKHGFAVPSYNKFTDFQILKKAAVFDVEKMRTIQLMPAAFNMNNKKTGRDVMARAEQLDLLPDEQSGSRKANRSILTALNKVLANDLIRARRVPSVLIFNDAKSCYDRIVLWIAALALRRLGTSKNATLEMMKTLQKADHKICTAYGNSESTYGGSDTVIPLQGVGQGNGAGPAIWVAISSVLLSIMRKKVSVCPCFHHSHPKL